MVVNSMSYATYDSYKDSGVDWLGEIPNDWDVCKLKFLLDEVNVRSKSGNEELLSLSKYQGIIPKNSLDERSGGASTLVGYKKVFKETLVINKMQATNGLLAISKIEGITSPDYSIYKTKNNEILDIDYLGFLLTLNLYLSEFKKRVTGVMEGFIRLYTDDLYEIHSIIPPITQQKKIVNFLNQKTAQIDQAIALKQQQIEKLNEYKQIVIQNAVTKGLNPNAPMKNSGVDWIGDIPEHWQMKRLKYVLDERNERSKTGEEPLFMVSQKYGLVVRADYHEKAEVAQSNIDNKIVYKNDLVFNKLKPHLGVFYKSEIDFKGLVSPDYAVYKVKNYIYDMKYLELLFRNPKYIEQFIIRATGIVEGLIRLYTASLFELPVMIPPKEEQKAILNFVKKENNKIDISQQNLEKQIDRLKEYKNILINQAVTGKIKI